MAHSRRTRSNPSPPSHSPSPTPASRRGRTSNGKAPTRPDRKEKKKLEKADVGRQAGVSDVDMLDEVPATVKKSGATKTTTGKRKLAETETEHEVHSEAPTADLDRDPVIVSSELSELEDMVAATPKPKKKKHRGDDKVVPANTSVSHTRHTSSTNDSQTHANKDKRSDKESGAKAVRPNNDDIAAFMQVPLDAISPRSSASGSDDTFSRRTFLLHSSSAKSDGTSSSSKATSVARASGSASRSSGSSTALSSSSEVSRAPPRVSRTKAVSPAPMAKPPKPTQAQPFEPDTNKMAKGKGKKPRPHTREQGIVGSDTEDIERLAALSSPAKNGARVTSQHLVNIKESEPQINIQEPTPRKPAGNKGAKRARVRVSKRDAQSSGEDSDVEIVEDSSKALQVPQSSRNRSKSRSVSPSRWRQDDLPKGTDVDKRWKKYLVPTLLQYQGAQLEPWNWVDGTTVPAVQMIWDAIFGDDLPHTVEANDCVHGLATQKLWDWRSSFRQAAEVVVAHYLDSSPLTRDAQNRAAFSEKIIEGGRFLYENPLADNTKRLFRSQFTLTVLAVHLDATKDALNIPGLYPKGTDPRRPIGAIGLAAAALERIFKLYGSGFMALDQAKGVWKAVPQYNPSSGGTSASYAEFSEVRFQGPTNQYVERANKMPHARIAAIVDAAREYMGKRSTLNDHAPMAEVEVHGRNELADDDDDD